MKIAQQKYAQENGGKISHDTSKLKNYGYDEEDWNTQLSTMRKKIRDESYIIFDAHSILTTDEYYAKVYGDSYVQANRKMQEESLARETNRIKKSQQTEEEKRQLKLEQQRKREEAREASKKESNAALEKLQKEAAEKLTDLKKKQKEANEAHKKEYEAYKEERKNKLAKEALERHSVRSEGVQKQKEQAQKDAEEARKTATEALKKYKESDGYYNGSAKDALQDMKRTVKDIFKATTSGISKEMSESLKSTEEGSLGKAKEKIAEVFGGITGNKDSSSIIAKLKGGLSQEDLAALVQKSALDLQKDLTTGQLTEQIIIDSIARRVQEQMDSIKSLASSTVSAFLIQKAYINAYLKETFGDPEFVAQITSIVSQKVDNYLDALTAESLRKLNTTVTKKIDNTFTRIETKIDTTTKKINAKLDRLTKLDLLTSLNEQISKVTSLDSLINKMNKNPVLSLFTPVVQAVSDAGAMVIQAQFYKPKFLTKIAHVQEKIISVQKALNKAKEFVQQKTQMIKTYIENLKQKAMNAVTQYATRIVNDIKSKISVAVSGAIGGLSF